MTPWAELLLDPSSAGDDEVRRRYHSLVREEHPDSRPDHRPGPRWQPLTEAYQMLRTEASRAAYQRRLARSARRCAGCRGLGVSVRTVGRDRGVRLCPTCGGEGR